MMFRKLLKATKMSLTFTCTPLKIVAKSHLKLSRLLNSGSIACLRLYTRVPKKTKNAVLCAYRDLHIDV